MAFKVCVKSFSIRVLSVLLFFCMGGKVIAQDFIRGKVIDAQTGKGISRVSINWLDGDSGGSSDTLDSLSLERWGMSGVRWMFVVYRIQC